LIKNSDRNSADRRPERVTLDEQDWRAVRQSPMFREVGGDVLARLLGDKHPIVYAPRQLIFSQGDEAEGFFLILDGWVKIYRITPSGEEAVVGLFARGESFAEAAVFKGSAYPACAEAASALRVLKIESGRFTKAMESEPGLAAALLGSVVAHTERLFEEIANLKLLSAPRRLADFLLRQAPHGAACAKLVLPYEKTLLAGRLGMTPETLSRALATLRKLGVAVERDHVAISDLAALETFARSARGHAAQPAK
jgi:CRP-like cAMP-binding protein